MCASLSASLIYLIAEHLQEHFSVFLQVPKGFLSQDVELKNTFNNELQLRIVQ